MKKTLLLSLLTLIFSCDSIYCSSEKLSKLDEKFLFELNSKFSDFDIYPDECYPLGHYNVRIRNETKIDTLALKSILNLTLERKSLPDRIQVFGSKNDFKFILYKVKNKYMILLISDL